MDYKIHNIIDKIDLIPFQSFAYALPQIRKLVPDLPLDPEVVALTKDFYNDTNNCNYIAFADQDDVKSLPWNLFDEVFDLRNKSFCIINQPPGQYVNPHFDSYLGYCKKNNVPFEKANLIQRHIIFLDDWQWGQSFCFPNSTLTGWNLGDVVSWPYKTWHSTANAGLKNRIVVTITGIPHTV